MIIFSFEGSVEFSITTDPSDQWDPAIYGDIVIWTDGRNGSWDIYGYNFSTQEEFEIRIDRFRQQWDPAIYGDVVVFADIIRISTGTPFLQTRSFRLQKTEQTVEFRIALSEKEKATLDNLMSDDNAKINQGLKNFQELDEEQKETIVQDLLGRTEYTDA